MELLFPGIQFGEAARLLMNASRYTTESKSKAGVAATSDVAIEPEEAYRRRLTAC